jgi:hypothetical protein
VAETAGREGPPVGQGRQPRPEHDAAVAHKVFHPVIEVKQTDTLFIIDGDTKPEL